MEFYAKQSFDFDEDTTDTEDDSGIAEISSSYNTNNNSDQQYRNHHHDEDVPLDLDALDTTTPPGLEQQLDQQPQSQDALGRFFSYWWVNEFESQ